MGQSNKKSGSLDSKQPTTSQAQGNDSAGGDGENVDGPAGRMSAKLDRNAAPRQGGFGDRESGPGFGPDAKFNEQAIEVRDEQIDERSVGDESTIEENEEEAQPRTSLEDVTLAKPKPALQRAEQPIPLEYQDVLK